jgi:hypothetical protein
MAATDTATADAVTFKTLRQSKMEAAQAALNHLERLFSQMQQVFCFAKPWECARVLASLLGSGTPIQSDAGGHIALQLCTPRQRSIWWWPQCHAQFKPAVEPKRVGAEFDPLSEPGGSESQPRP